MQDALVTVPHLTGTFFNSLGNECPLHEHASLNIRNKPDGLFLMAPKMPGTFHGLHKDITDAFPALDHDGRRATFLAALLQWQENVHGQLFAFIQKHRPEMRIDAPLYDLRRRYLVNPAGAVIHFESCNAGLRVWGGTSVYKNKGDRWTLLAWSKTYDLKKFLAKIDEFIGQKTATAITAKAQKDREARVSALKGTYKEAIKAYVASMAGTPTGIEWHGLGYGGNACTIVARPEPGYYVRRWAWDLRIDEYGKFTIKFQVPEQSYLWAIENSNPNDFVSSVPEPDRAILRMVHNLIVALDNAGRHAVKTAGLEWEPKRIKS